MRNKLMLSLLGLLLCTLVCCTGKLSTDSQRGVELNQIKLKLSSTVECNAGQELSCAFVKDYGPALTDQVVLRRDSEEDVVLSINSLEENYFKYTLPARFQYGTYSFCLRRNGALKGFGKVNYVKSGSSGSEGGDKVEIGPEAGSTVWGQVCCDGEGIPGVVVSDGVEVVCTDENGVYQLASAKKNGYVFISIPSGYEVDSRGVLPIFHKELMKSPSSCERVDFNLYESGDQSEHVMLYFGDMHLAARKVNNDRTQFSRFTSEINEYLKAHQNAKVYALTLGDMTWDLYWYTNLYGFDEYLKDVNAIQGLQIFHTIGNHDHDMDATGDFDTVEKYRQKICPNYYSFNIGRIHYVVLDDIECTNSVASKDNGDYRDYKNNLLIEELEWLKKDISFIPKDAPVVVTLHAPVHNKEGSAIMGNNSVFTSILSGHDLTIVSGHTHVVYNVKKSTLYEYNSGAICAAWWWAGKYYPTLNIGTDGAPSGYRITTVKGESQESVFKAVGRDENYQFRAYDRNSICLTAENVGVPSSRSSLLYAEDYGEYRTASSANEVLINVWDWDPSWKVEVMEGGKSLTVSQINTYDPAFMLTYTIPRLKENNGVTWHLSKTNHIFKATASSATSTLEIKVTDDEGRVYTQTMSRPLAFTADTYK